MILQSESKGNAECYWRQASEATRLESVQLAQANNIHQRCAQMMDASQAEGISIRPLPSDCAPGLLQKGSCWILAPLHTCHDQTAAVGET